MNDALSKAELLSEMSEAARVRLEEFFEPRTYQDGFLLFQQGQEASELLVIVDGQVTLNKGKQEIASLTPGRCLGGMSLVLIGQRECGAMADGSVEVLVLTREAYLRLIADYPAVAIELLEAILREMGATTRDVLGDMAGCG